MDFELVIKSIPNLLDGAVLTIELTALSIVIGLAFAIPIALMRVSRNPALWMPVYGYIFYFRGTPLLVQIFLIYYGSGQFREELEALGLWRFFREPYFCAVLTLTLNTAAYTAEILRGAIRAVPFGEVEAARACGMSRGLLFRRIILPKAFRLALPAYSNEVVFLFQATSLVSIITLLDLTGIARIIVARSFAVYEIYIAAAVIYLIVTYGILYVFRRVEHRLSGHLRERAGVAAAGKETIPAAGAAPVAGAIAVR
jgi:His/Glu/Gln/Arg/opine family amino acid ABC transporter permease subunit